jgi:hypothetical protein
MKPIKRLGLVVMAALMVTAFVGAGSAMGEWTALCAPGAGEGEECPAESMFATHIHYVTLSGSKAKVLTGPFNVACDVLLLAESFVELAKPLIFFGNLTYANCGGGCSVAEENGPGEYRFLMTEHETASVVPEYLVKVFCSGFINCFYKAEEELLGTAKGPYLSSEENGSLTINEQTLLKESGMLCPAAKLDIVLTPLFRTHIVH